MPSARRSHAVRVRAAVRAVAELPRALRVVLVVALVFHAVGFGWGLPASDAWDVDGIAPRDILPGLASTFTPGDYYTYPPLHLAILAVLTLPVTAVAVVRAGPDVPAVVHEIIGVPYMTAVSVVARVVTLAMSLAIAVALARIAEDVTPGSEEERRRVGVWTALVASLSAPFTFYAHTSNLDVPYLFWATLSVAALVRGLARGEPRRLRTSAVLAALAIATKDQAYAVFLVAYPVVVVGWALVAKGAGRRAVVREAAIAAALALGTVLVVDGALVNPRGFAARLAFLRGPASQDFATYTKDAGARLQILADVVREVDRHYVPGFVAVALVGLVVALRRARGVEEPSSSPDGVTARARATLLALVPVAVAISFTVCFNEVARRVEERFTLPQALLLAVPVAVALDTLYRSRRFRAPLRALAGAFVVTLAYGAASVDATMLDDPRYQTEAFLAERARPGDVVEVHGNNVYLPRVDDLARASVQVVRVGPGAPERRGPLPGVVEVQAKYADIEMRRPRFVVVNTCWATRHRERDLSADGGRIYPTSQTTAALDVDARTLFDGLFEGRLAYGVAHEARTSLRFFRRAEIHGSLSCPVVTFERNEGGQNVPRTPTP